MLYNLQTNSTMVHKKNTADSYITPFIPASDQELAHSVMLPYKTFLANSGNINEAL